MRNTVIVIAGPTASGKTATAVKVAKHYNTKIISADSRQCFEELNIGVARPSERELEEIEHFFVADHSIHEKITANDFELFALQKSEEIFKTNPVVVVTAGTGLYLKALCGGLDIIPAINENIRNGITRNYKEKGLDWLQDQLSNKDPEFWQVAEKQNPQRLMRALEVLEVTGKSILHFRKGIKKERPFSIIKTAIQISKDDLHSNIQKRVDLMFENGLLDEVRSLLPFRHLNALQTVGYKELFEYFDGKVSLQEAKENIIRNTKQYAKRQMTWFKKDNEIKWLPKDHLLSEVSVAIC